MDGHLEIKFQNNVSYKFGDISSRIKSPVHYCMCSCLPLNLMKVVYNNKKSLWNMTLFGRLTTPSLVIATSLVKGIRENE